jgi:hypothetical protein
MADKTKSGETSPTPTDLGATRKRRAFTKKRGPRVFVKYEVVDASGNVIPGAVARLLRIERDQSKILEMTLNHTLDGEYLMVDVPINTVPGDKAEGEPTLAQAAE